MSAALMNELYFNIIFFKISESIEVPGLKSACNSEIVCLKL
jgi:hypothetical protein